LGDGGNSTDTGSSGVNKGDLLFGTSDTCSSSVF
jgi:hypothetical protein